MCGSNAKQLLIMSDGVHLSNSDVICWVIIIETALYWLTLTNLVLCHSPMGSTAATAFPLDTLDMSMRYCKPLGHSKQSSRVLRVDPVRQKIDFSATLLTKTQKSRKKDITHDRVQQVIAWKDLKFHILAAIMEKMVPVWAHVETHGIQMGNVKDFENFLQNGTHTRMRLGESTSWMSLEDVQGD